MTLYKTEINVIGYGDPYGRLGSESGSSGSGLSEVRVSAGNMAAWEDRVQTLRDIVTNGKYPCVVKVTSGNVMKYMQRSGVQDPAGSDVDGIVMNVLKPRRHKMVVTTKLQWERRTGEYTKTDKQYDINVAQSGSVLTLLIVLIHLPKIIPTT